MSPPTKEIRPQLGPQISFLTSPADLCIYGGAAGGGKTWALLLEPLRHIANPGFGAVFFRRTSPQITNEGGLWDESEKLYPYAGGSPLVGLREWRFPSGATISFRHLQHDKDRLAWQGAQVALLCFDELTEFSEAQFWYLLSRNRSTCGVRPYVRATCNPDADSWVANLLAWWIDDASGLPIPERAGQLRWLVRVNDELVWADTAEELAARHPGIPPKSLTFVPARLSDNQALMSADPGYLANLLALPLVERERLLAGNWKVRAEAGLVFNLAWFRLVERLPPAAKWVRYWDKASTPGKGDYSVGVKMGRTYDNQYIVADVLRGQWSSLDRNKIIRQTAALDGHEVEVWVEQEPGSGGKESAEISVRELAGYIVHAEPATGDKLTRARHLSAQAEGGNVMVLRAPWAQAYLREMHAFTGAPGGVDDQVDASSGAFNKLALANISGWPVNDDPRARSATAEFPAGAFGGD